MQARLTAEEKTRWAPMLVDVWHTIATDVHEGILPRSRGRAAMIAEMCCDASMPETYGGFTKEEARALSASYFNKDTQKWLRSVFEDY